MEKQNLIKREEIKIDNLEKNLTFIDGVLLTHHIYDRILKKNLSDEKGNPEKDKNGYDYLGIINDDVNELLFDKVIEQGYFKNRGDQLIHQFKIDN